MRQKKVVICFVFAYNEVLGVLTKSFCAPAICDNGSAEIAVRFKRGVSFNDMTRVFSTPGPNSLNESSFAALR